MKRTILLDLIILNLIQILLTSVTIMLLASCSPPTEKKDKMTTSFGEYFDIQRDKIVKDMQNKNKQQNVEWMEAYEKRQGMAEKRKEEVRYKKELIECSDKGIEISEECKTYFKKQFETSNAQIQL